MEQVHTLLRSASMEGALFTALEDRALGTGLVSPEVSAFYSTDLAQGMRAYCLGSSFDYRNDFLVDWFIR